jgi:hypothetical protein
MTKEHVIGVLYLECFQATQRIDQLDKEVQKLREENNQLSLILSSNHNGAGIHEEPAPFCEPSDK